MIEHGLLGTIVAGDLVGLSISLLYRFTDFSEGIGEMLLRRRRLRRMARRMVFGSATLIVMGAAIYKLLSSDVKKIEVEAKKPAEELTEAELREAMRKLGIQKLELTKEEEENAKRSYVQ